jgi:hypothetical protein
MFILETDQPNESANPYHLAVFDLNQHTAGDKAHAASTFNFTPLSHNRVFHRYFDINKCLPIIAGTSGGAKKCFLARSRVGSLFYSVTSFSRFRMRQRRILTLKEYICYFALTKPMIHNPSKRECI